jgi:SAM-dependent methyltransferase
MSEYTGKDTLEVLEAAKNYSRFLASSVHKLASPTSRVLDFGAGTGHIASMVTGFVAELVAVEADPELRRQLKKRGITCAELADLADSSFDLIYTLNVLEHIDDDAEAVKSLASKLKPGGVLYIYVPANPILYSNFDARIGHFRRYTRESAAAMLSKSQLEPFALKFHDPIGYFAALFYRFAVNSGRVGEKSIRIFDRILFPLSRFLEPLTSSFLGKNIAISARKPDV